MYSLRRLFFAFFARNVLGCFINHIGIMADIKNLFMRISSLVCIILLFACQTKRTTKAMNENQINEQLAPTDRLLSLANLELTDSNRKVIAWFFETPQVFEFNLDSEKAENIYKILKEAKEKELPVNVRSKAQKDKNIITLVIPATEEQVNHFKMEKAQREVPIKITAPPHN
jgi:hypothetical protein